MKKTFDKPLDGQKQPADAVGVDAHQGVVHAEVLDLDAVRGCGRDDAGADSGACCEKKFQGLGVHISFSWLGYCSVKIVAPK